MSTYSLFRCNFFSPKFVKFLMYHHVVEGVCEYTDWWLFCNFCHILLFAVFCAVLLCSFCIEIVECDWCSLSFPVIVPMTLQQSDIVCDVTFLPLSSLSRKLSVFEATISDPGAALESDWVIVFWTTNPRHLASCPSPAADDALPPLYQLWAVVEWGVCVLSVLSFFIIIRSRPPTKHVNCKFRKIIDWIRTYFCDCDFVTVLYAGSRRLWLCVVWMSPPSISDFYLFVFWLLRHMKWKWNDIFLSTRSITVCLSVLCINFIL